MDARTLFFSQSQKTSIHSGAPVCPIRYLESWEKATHTNSWAWMSPALRCFFFLPCSCCRSNTVTQALSPHSDTARKRRLALTAIARTLLLFSEPVEREAKSRESEGWTYIHSILTGVVSETNKLMSHCDLNHINKAKSSIYHGEGWKQRSRQHGEVFQEKKTPYVHICFALLYYVFIHIIF